MRIICISDTHLRHNFEVPDGDLLIHAGDATISGTPSELIKFNAWFSAQTHKHKILIAGNHDWIFQKDFYNAKSLLSSNITYLQDEWTMVEGLKIFGSPWQPVFMDWAFNLPREELKKKWEHIPSEVDILITHGPPYGIRDFSPFGNVNVGCRELRKMMFRKFTPKLHVFGHIHSSYGSIKLNDTWFYNSSICNEAYKAVNKPLVFTLP